LYVVRVVIHHAIVDVGVWSWVRVKGVYGIRRVGVGVQLVLVTVMAGRAATLAGRVRIGVGSEIQRLGWFSTEYIFLAVAIIHQRVCCFHIPRCVCGVCGVEGG